MALHFHDLGTRWAWVVNVTPQPPLPPGKTRYPEAAFEGGKWGDRPRPRSWGGPALQA